MSEFFKRHSGWLFFAGCPSHWPGIAQIGAGAAFRMGCRLVGVALEPSWRRLAGAHIVVGLTGTLAAVPGSVVRFCITRFLRGVRGVAWR